MFQIKLLKTLGIKPNNHPRQIWLRDGTCLTYRLNDGDLQSIREVWLDEAYRLPFKTKYEVLVDLGTNIGLTSLWLSKRYGFSTIVAVEPDSSNAKLARINFEKNNVQAEVIEAAIGPTDGSVLFQESESSNLGRVSTDSGKAVRCLSMKTLLVDSGVSNVDVLKMDIEGGEEALLRGDISWANQVKAIIAEFHPTVIDYAGAVQILQGAGYRYIPANSAHANSMDSFVRNDG
ncbi:MAG: FkbM family methyltransferase [Cyanobacteria bacterium]|nr:FkbM family methyltransferase [Cyanobacteriota bacterium]